MTVLVFTALLELFDILLLAATGLLANWTRFGTVDIGGTRGLAFLVVILIGFFAFRAARLHDPAILRLPYVQSGRSLMGLLLVFVATLVVGYLTKTSDDVSRLWGGLWLVGASFTFVATRPWVTLLYLKLERSRALKRRFVVVGSTSEFDRLDRFIERWSALMPEGDVVEGIFLDQPCAPDTVPLSCRGLIQGSLDDFVHWCESHTIDAGVALLPAGDADRITPVIDRLRALAIDIDLVTGDVDSVWASRPLTRVAGLPAVRIVTRPLEFRDVISKRIEDLVVASLALVLLSPVMVLIALAVRLESPGPVLFRQARHGFNNRPFTMLKFRSMYNTDDVQNTVAQARRDDPRVTRVGAFLRRTSLDELPQLLNVLMGSMSVVGPRPHAVQHNDHFAQLINSYLARHRIKPGITGWAQVQGLRGETDTVDKMRQRVEHDLHYVDHWTLGLDLRIMLMTVRVLIHPHAY